MPLGSGKLEIMNDMVSKALIDENIWDEEFSLVLKQLSQYKEFKKKIRTINKEPEKKRRHRRDLEKTVGQECTTTRKERSLAFFFSKGDDGFEMGLRCF